MSLTPKQIETVAHLARLELRPEQLSRVADSLGRIIDMVSQLERADTASVAPMAHPLAGQVQRLRADQVTSGNARDELQRNAPQVESGLYLVPRVIE